MPNLLVEIGNTALKAAWSEGITLGKTFRYQGEKMFDYVDSLVEKEKPAVMVISSTIDISRAEEEGDALYFAKRMKNSIFAVCNLVMMGLALIADKYYVERKG